ncbi:hypothetical protein [Brachyspira murdochii]|uniref:Uncharacterized protein n=2 Tax=Brachyspira murdochii TaxID=84378 RepID=D5U3X4_BRAM5|nr:hypothetical protein [Brachyspira murdochii]ADG70141.1 hypothetical protein Bmur_0030 [Brachyspira murdochii DSM 12563]PPS21666.1 hypothetical protein DJ52_09495 [Brachyspira murdochii]
MGEIIDAIIDIIRTFINIIRRIIVKIINFAKHIARFFKDKIKQFKKDISKIFISLKLDKDEFSKKIAENMESGNYNEVSMLDLSPETEKTVINVVYDRDTNSITDYEENAELIEAESGIDQVTLKKFKGKNMIVHKS